MSQDRGLIYAIVDGKDKIRADVGLVGTCPLNGCELVVAQSCQGGPLFWIHRNGEDCDAW